MISQSISIIFLMCSSPDNLAGIRLFHSAQVKMTTQKELKCVLKNNEVISIIVDMPKRTRRKSKKRSRTSSSNTDELAKDNAEFDIATNAHTDLNPSDFERVLNDIQSLKVKNSDFEVQESNLEQMETELVVEEVDFHQNHSEIIFSAPDIGLSMTQKSYSF